MATALMMSAQGLEPPPLSRRKKNETAYDKKKCKSCKYFTKGGRGILCTCNVNSTIRTVNPLDVACYLYLKRKK